MPNIAEPFPLWFTFSTIAVLLAFTALGIVVVLQKSKKMKQNKGA
jgi:hypothetical protein